MWAATRTVATLCYNIIDKVFMGGEDEEDESEESLAMQFAEAATHRH